MDLPGIKVNGHFVPLRKIININICNTCLVIWYEGVIKRSGEFKKKPCYVEILNKSPDYDRISKWMQNQDVISDVVAQLEERIEQLEDKVNELEYSPTPGAKFLAAQEHYSSLAREQKE